MKKAGVNICALSPWALLGSFGWNKLLTCESCEYETGAYDISAGNIRPTAVAALIKKFTQQSTYENPVLNQPGWWKREDRFHLHSRKKANAAGQEVVRPLVIIGKNGTLGTAFSKICTGRHIHHYLLGRNEVDIANSGQLEAMADRYQPWAIINAAGYVRVDDAESDKERCYRENDLAAQKLAILCMNRGIKLLSFSSDLVFDGKKAAPYIETDQPAPLNTYGHSKMLAENFLCNVNPSSLVIRTSAFFGPWDKHNFISQLLEKLAAGETVTVSNDLIISPTYVPHLVHASLDLLVDDASGIWHLANKGALTWYAFARLVARLAGFDVKRIVAGYSLPAVAPRPAYSALSSKKYSLMPSLEDAARQYLAEQTVFKQPKTLEKRKHDKV